MSLLSTQGERLLDLCIGLTGGSFLTFKELQDTLLMYHEAEQSVLKGVLVYAFLEALLDLFDDNGTEQEFNTTQTLLHSILKASEKELLGNL